MTELPNQGSGFTTEEENEEFLRCLVEECCEVGQRVVKAERFGLTQTQTGHDLDNAQRIVEELHDLISVAIILEARGLLGGVLPTEDVVRAKRRKILRYMSVKRTGEDPAPRSPELEDPLPDDELEWHRNPTASKERAWVGYDPRTGRIARTSASPPSKAPKTFAASGPIAATEDTYQGLREGTIGWNSRLTTPPATTVPSEPEAKGKAGAGPVGEAVAGQWRALEDASPRTGWHPEGYGDEAGWVVLAAEDKRFTVERRPLYTHPVEEPDDGGGAKEAAIVLRRELAETRERLEKRAGAAEARFDAARGLIRDAVGLVPLAHQNWHADARAALSTQESSADLAPEVVSTTATSR